MRYAFVLLMIIACFTVSCLPIKRPADNVTSGPMVNDPVNGTETEPDVPVLRDYIGEQEVVLRETLKDSGVIIIRLGQTIKLIMPNQLTFEVNSPYINANFYQPLNTISVVINKYGNTRIKILGYTDSSGDFAANQLLSEDRARSVSSYLIHKGVNPSRLYVQGMSDRFPIVPNDTPAGRATNRRVELHIEPVYR